MKLDPSESYRFLLSNVSFANKLFPVERNVFNLPVLQMFHQNK